VRCALYVLEDESGGQLAIASKNDNLVIIYKQNKYCLSKRHCDVISSNMVTGF